MKNELWFSILRFRFSFISGESLNVGLLIQFPDNELAFISSDRVKGLKKLYPSLDLYYFRRVLKNFESRARDYSQDYKIGGPDLFFNKHLNLLIEEIFLPRDSSSLFFDEPNSLAFSNKENAIEYLNNKYLIKTGTHDDWHPINDDNVLRKFNNRFRSKVDDRPSDYFINDIIIKGNYSQENFSLGWKNGKINLIQPLSFDLSSQDSIRNKSLHWWALLHDLGQVEFNQENYGFDLITAPPSKGNLTEEYKKALSFLVESNSQVRIKELPSIDSYIEEIVEMAH